MEWTQRLRIRQLHILVELHRTLNVSHTAASLNMTQPALSKWLAEFEGDLGVILFERLPKGLVPTRFCEALIVHARTILSEIERTQRTIRLMAEGASDHIAVGATHAVAASVVPAAIGPFRKQYPDVYLTLEEGILQELVQGLRESRLDFVIGRMDARVSCEELRFEEIYEESVRVVADPTHPLARQGSVAWAQTRDYAWIGLPKGSQLRSELEYELAVAAEPAPRVRIETSSFLSTMALLQRSELLGLTSGRAANFFASRGYITILPLPYAGKGSVGLLSPREAEPTRVRRAFRECVLAQAAGTSPAAPQVR